VPLCTVNKSGMGLPRRSEPLRVRCPLPQERGRASAPRRSTWLLSQDPSLRREEELGPVVSWASPLIRPPESGALCMK
jgi:hypothetical protein